MATVCKIIDLQDYPAHEAELEAVYRASGQRALDAHPRWPFVLQTGLGHAPYLLAAFESDRCVGYLGLNLISGPIFGRYLVSQPYLNYGGPITTSNQVRQDLLRAAVDLAKHLDVKHLEIREACQFPDENAGPVPKELSTRSNAKLNAYLPLAASTAEQWDALRSKCRNLVRKSINDSLKVEWGRQDLLPDFFQLFARNMRDLGTPSFGQDLFDAILTAFPGETEICVVRYEGQAAAASLVFHGPGISQVPSASSHRELNHTKANMRLYWAMLERSVERGQRVFDFGRCTENSGPHKFKKQWGASFEPVTWHYCIFAGDPGEMRRESSRFSLARNVWTKLPMPVANTLGPIIARGLP